MFVYTGLFLSSLVECMHVSQEESERATEWKWSLVDELCSYYVSSLLSLGKKLCSGDGWWLRDDDDDDGSARKWGLYVHCWACILWTWHNKGRDEMAEVIFFWEDDICIKQFSVCNMPLFLWFMYVGRSFWWDRIDVRVSSAVMIWSIRWKWFR